MSKSELIQKGRKEVLESISDAFKECFNIELDVSSKDRLIKQLILLLIEKPCLLKYHKVTCKLSQVLLFQRSLTGFLDRLESGLQSQTKLKLGSVHFDLQVLSDSEQADKTFLINQISETFNDFSSELAAPAAKLEKIEERLKASEDFNANPLEHMKFPGKGQADEIDQSLSHLSPAADLPYFTYDIMLVKFQKKQDRLVKELEWERRNLVELKYSLERKKKKFADNKAKLLEKYEEVKKEVLILKSSQASLNESKSNNSLASTKPSSENSSLTSDFSPKPQSQKFSFQNPQASTNFPSKILVPSFISEIQKKLEKTLCGLDLGDYQLIRSNLFEIRAELALACSSSIHSRLSPRLAGLMTGEGRLSVPSSLFKRPILHGIEEL